MKNNKTVSRREWLEQCRCLPWAESLLRFNETRDVLLTGSRVLTPAAVFLKIEGTANDGITIKAVKLTELKLRTNS